MTEPAPRRRVAGLDVRVAVVVAAVLVIVGSAAYIWYLEPDELGHEAYAARLCREVLAPLHESRSTEDESLDLQRFRDGTALTVKDREKAITAFSSMAESVNRRIGQLGDFNDRYVLTGEDGHRFQADLNDALDDWADSYTETRADIEALDPAAPENLPADMAAIRAAIGGLAIAPTSAAVVEQLRQDLAVGTPACADESALFTIAAP